MTKKGFTLIELLIVIGVLAIFATIAVLILNPARLLQESRDSQRLSDIDTVNSAIAFYLATNTTPTFVDAWRCTWGTAGGAGTAPCAAATTPTAANMRLLTNVGWVAINLGTTSGISRLPMDPVGAQASQTALLHYSAETANASKTWELTAQMESARYVNTGTGDKESTDGGNNADCYEKGNDLTLVGAAEC